MVARDSTGGRKAGCAARICADPGNGGAEDRETIAGGLIQNWGCDWGIGIGGQEGARRLGFLECASLWSSLPIDFPMIDHLDLPGIYFTSLEALKLLK